MASECCIVVAAKDDAVIPASSSMAIHKAWPGSEILWLQGGHVSSILFHCRQFRKAIVKSLQKLSFARRPFL